MEYRSAFKVVSWFWILRFCSATIVARTEIMPFCSTTVFRKALDLAILCVSTLLASSLSAPSPFFPVASPHAPLKEPAAVGMIEMAALIVIFALPPLPLLLPSLQLLLCRSENGGKDSRGQMTVS
jgi:hypothetical protein